MPEMIKSDRLAESSKFKISKWSSMFTGVWISVFFRLITFWRQILCVCVFFFFNTVAFIRSFQSLVILQNSSCIFKKWPLPLPKSYYNTISLLFTQTWLLCTFLQHCINHSVTIRVCDIVCHSGSHPTTDAPRHWFSATAQRLYTEWVVWHKSPLSHTVHRDISMNDYPSAGWNVSLYQTHLLWIVRIIQRHFVIWVQTFFFFKVKHPFFREQNNPWFDISACCSCNFYFSDIWDNNTSSFVSVDYYFWFIAS